LPKEYELKLSKAESLEEQQGAGIKAKKVTTSHLPKIYE
jgi:hypothetical protein